MSLDRGSLLRCLLYFVAVFSPVIPATVPAFADGSAPKVVSSLGYINRKPLTSHVTARFYSTGASTIVAYISSHPSWNGHRVSIVGINDNFGNSWKALEGPTPWEGSTFTLLSAIYYVNAPITGAEHELTIDLTNPAPLVVDVIAVSGSDITSPPIHSAIDSMQPGLKSIDVISKPIAVPDHTLLLAWAKNELGATASALDDYSLDRQSPSFLWGESKAALAAGSYRSHFRYDTAIGFQTAIVGVRTAILPVAISQSVKTDRSTPVSIILSASSPNGFPLTCRLLSAPKHGRLSGSCPKLMYTPESHYTGSDQFTFSENDGTSDSNTASVRIKIDKRPLIQGLDQEHTKIAGFSVVLAVIIGLIRLLVRQTSFGLVAVQECEPLPSEEIS